MENHHFYWVNPLYMAIFNSFLYVYQAGYIGYLQMTSPFLVPGYFGILRIRVDSPESDYRLTRKRPYLQFRIIQKSDYISIVSLVSTLRPRSCCIHLFHGTLPRHLRARRRAWRCPLGCLHFARCHLPPWTQRLHQHHHLCPICKKTCTQTKHIKRCTGMYTYRHLQVIHNIFTVMFFSTSELFVWRTDLQPADPTAEASASADSDSGSKRWRWQWCMYLSWYGYESKYII